MRLSSQRQCRLGNKRAERRRVEPTRPVSSGKVTIPEFRQPQHQMTSFEEVDGGLLVHARRKNGWALS